MSTQDESANGSLKSRTTKGLVWSGLSNGLQQILGALFGIALARMLTPSDYGMIAMVTIFSLIASAFQESGFVNGIANKSTVAHRDYNAVFWCSISVGTILYILLFLSAPLIASYYGIPELKPLSRLVFLGFWTGSFGIAHNAYLFRNLMVKERAISTLTAIIVSNIVGVILAYLGFSYWGIAIQTILYAATTSALFFYFSKFRPSFNIDFKPIREIIGFSSKIFITNVFIHLNNNVYSLILGKFYKPEDVGNVNQAIKWNLMGQSVITNMVNNVTQPVLQKIQTDQDRQLRVFRKILAFTSFIAFPSLFGLALVSNEFILIALTAKWSDSAAYLQPLCIGGAFLVVSNVFANFILSKGKSNLYMFSILSFGILQLLILLAAHSYSILFMLQLTVLLQFSWIFVWLSLAKPYIKYSLKNMFHDIFSYAILAALAALVAHFAFSLITNIYLRFIVAVFTMGGAYIALNKLFLPAILDEVLEYVKNIKRKKTV
ncbi:lipopolysaccharide biosynthesis protein [Sphingobacterium yanglingense]|uniref:O-antigen/teichoic acid export membrane protein n=1 Tax=Sphingobacterium yanglingense TaxID=1437280 RepID=A0A4R6WCJ5_9SPHI|nr:lipopolysaccharide biosynthesis protein [Sphingobacterium yanglingense]TDQ75464.1 O-antigen/teichoic acid export membrane protein [Sphingobacterium yanglingense]